MKWTGVAVGGKSLSDLHMTPVLTAWIVLHLTPLSAMDCNSQGPICDTLYVSVGFLCVYVSGRSSLPYLFWFHYNLLLLLLTYWHKQGIGNGKSCSIEWVCWKHVWSWRIKSPFSYPKSVWYARCMQGTSLVLLFDMLNIYCPPQFSCTFSMQHTLQICWGYACPVGITFGAPRSRWSLSDCCSLFLWGAACREPSVRLA